MNTASSRPDGHRAGKCSLLIVLAILCSSTLRAQDTTRLRADTTSTPGTPERDYLARRQSTLDDIRGAQKKLAELRSERIALESRVENVAVKAAQQRAQDLLMSHETTALRGLDSILTAAQDNLLAQRDRFLSLGQAVRRRAAAELVVLVRVDSAALVQSVDSIGIQVDSAPASVRRYSPAAVDALNAGAIDEVYHSDVLPATHIVMLHLALNGGAVEKAVSVDVPTGAVTYVQCALRAGQPVLTTWSSRGSGAP
jgi:hypothetical protein